MPYAVITSAVTIVCDKKSKMSVDFFRDDGTLVSSEAAFEVDADTDDGIKAELARASIARAAAAPVREALTIRRNDRVESSYDPRARR